MKYYPTLDGLRFFAVFLVIISHWLPDSHMLNYLPNGAIGVTIFFVLSGYLISKILFVYKDKIINQEVTFRKAISTFVIRRSFRIFPIYYILIFFLFFLTSQVFFSKERALSVVVVVLISCYFLIYLYLH